jgi:HSP20 family protein
LKSIDQQEQNAMNEKTPVTQQPAPPVSEQTEAELSMRPAVDIFEDETGIAVRADMLGANRDHLDIRVGRDTLTLAGEADIAMPEGMEAFYTDARLARYQRSSSLSSELDADQADTFGG